MNSFYAYLLPLFPEQASSVAGSVDELYFFLVAVSLFFATLIVGVIFYFFVRYRRLSHAEMPQPVEGSLKLELAWIVVPFILAMVMFVWGASVFFGMSRAPRDTMDIYVVGKQWMWKIQHPEGHREINELHVPVNTNIKLTMTTEDVIHSFYIPDFRIKQDVVPGRYTTLWFKATKPGRYHLYCAEYCGTQHSGMIGWVYVMEPADYQAWLSGSTTEGSMASSGQKLFQDFACNTCHRADAQGRGPVLDGLFGKNAELQGGQSVKVDESYVRKSILDPRAQVVAGFEPIMPTYDKQISEEQLLQLIAYIKSLGAPAQQQQGSTGAAPTQAGTPQTGTPSSANMPDQVRGTSNSTNQSNSRQSNNNNRPSARQGNRQQ